MPIDVLSSTGMASVARSNLTRANGASLSSITKLSSGNRITNAADDVAGMSVGTGLRSSVKTIQAGLQNVAQGNSMLQIAEGGLSQISEILQRQKELAVMASSGSMTDSERGFLDTEFQNLKIEIDRIANETSFNGVPLLNGSNIKGEPLLQGANPVLPVDTITDSGAIGIGAGRLRVVDANGVVGLTPDERLIHNTQVYGAIDRISISDVAYGSVANIEVEINGVVFSGTVEHGATYASVSNGNDYLQVGTAAFDLTDQITAEVSRAQMFSDFGGMRISRRAELAVPFSNTRLEGSGLSRVWVSSSYGNEDSVSVKNFRYIGSDGPNSARVSAELNGITVTAVVPDQILAFDSLVFLGTSRAERITVRLPAGMEMEFGVNGIGNIREDENQRQLFLDALNKMFGWAGDGLDMGVAATANGQDINMDIAAVTSPFLYDSIDVGLESIAQANITSIQLNTAIDYVTNARADVGAQQSRLNFASSNMTVALQNQDAARGVYQDTDVAQESTRYATSQTQIQAAIAMLAQANNVQSNMLELLG